MRKRLYISAVFKVLLHSALWLLRRCFSELVDILEHKDLCLKIAVGLKSTLHQAIKTLEKELQSSPHNYLIMKELKSMRQYFSIITYKLYLNDRIELDAFNL